MLQVPILRSEAKCFGGKLGFYQHFSEQCQAEMRFAVFTPPLASQKRVPVLYCLSGLTCTEENFVSKAGAQRYAAENGIMLVAPDTSPRGLGFPGEAEDWAFGSGAGFYLDATAEPWAKHYRMYSYVVEELPQLIGQHFSANTDRQGIMGHSMGGHGALVCALRNGDRYLSVSAFSPIAAPVRSPWGKKAFTGYLGPDEATWKAYDASELVATANFGGSILIDQGTADTFLAGQLMPQVFEQACNAAGQLLTLRMQPGYDHSYYFIATFMEDHIKHHATALLV
ncbi:MAG: S-formylglutathione hydrolase [Synechococcales cyanobacterium CRU_2_2]|nr:S-formylglutathione hydrolase [Synechococcales cyanobacterium CRU_2_2]